MMETLSRIFQFIIFPLIGLVMATMAAIFGGALVIGKYAAAWELLRWLFR